jgi:hypothetical protein
MSEIRAYTVTLLSYIFLVSILLSFTVAAEKEKTTPPLDLEVIPGQITLDRNQSAESFLLLHNSTPNALGPIELSVHFPDDLKRVFTTWANDSKERPVESGKSIYNLHNFEPFAQKGIKLRFKYSGAWTDIKTATVMVQVAYQWKPEGINTEVPAELFRPLTVKVGVLEGLNIFGIPLALAIFVVPGLVGIAIIGAITTPAKWVEENKLFVAFLASTALILLWDWWLRPRLWVNGPDLWTGVSVEVLAGFSGIAVLLGLPLGFIFRKCRRTALEKWPIQPDQQLAILVANLILRGMFPAHTSRIEFKRQGNNDADILSAVYCRGDTPEEVVLLPRGYGIQTTDTKLKNKVKKSLSSGKATRRFAKLLLKHPTILESRFNIKYQAGKKAGDEYPEGDKPIWRMRDEIDVIPETTPVTFK